MGTIHNRKYLKETRQNLRNNGTSAEAVLWTQLKGSQLDGRKFRRQHSVENFIIDFYCPSEKLAIELDGQSHFTIHGSRNDDVRSRILEKHQIMILRYENNLIYSSLESVLEDIKMHFRK